VIQKLCEFASYEHQALLLSCFAQNIKRTVEQQIACRVLQRFIGCTSPQNVLTLFARLKSTACDAS
jgi:hypothetical protein